MKKLLTLTLTLALALTLACCGWSPMYKSENNLQGRTRYIYIAPISGTNGIDLRNALKAKFGTDNEADAKYILNVDLAAPYTVYKAIQLTGDATWQEVRLVANYKLLDAKSNDVIVTGHDTASESYTFVRDLVAAQASYNNAIQSSIRVLSEKIETRVNAKLANSD